MKSPVAWSKAALSKPLLALALSWSIHPAIAQVIPQAIAQAETLDGFVASCTGNLDGTGQCTNQETNQRFTCVIIPGQVIECKSPKAKSFQCVWVSGVQANYADFWCDPQVDALLRNEISSQSLQPSLSSPLGPGPSGAAFPGNEINSDRYSRDRFKPDDSKLGDPFGKPITTPADDGPGSDSGFGIAPGSGSSDLLTPAADQAPASNTSPIAPLLPSQSP